MLVSSVIVTLGMALIMGILYHYFNQQLFRELQKEALYLSRGVLQDGISYLKELEGEAARVTYVDTDGTVLFDSETAPSSMENHADRKEIREALASGSGKAARSSVTLSERTIYYARRLSNGRVLRVSTTQYTVIELILQLAKPVMWILGLMIILSLAAAFYISKKIMEPVNELNLEEPEEGETYEEIAPLIRKIRNQNRQIQNQLAAAKRQQEEFSIITENMREGLLVIDRYTMLLSGNSSGWRFFDSKDKTGQSVYSLNRSEDFRRCIETVLEGKHTDSILKIREQHIRLIANPVAGNEKTEGAVLLLVDMTETMERENLRREFSANVSHELMTPLTSISGYAEIIKGGLVKEADIQSFAGKVFDEAQRLIALLEDTIKISQLDEGQIPYEKQNVDLYQLAKETCKSLQEKANNKNVHIYVEGGRTPLFTVETVFREIMYNLCDNAVKYNKENGSVIVHLEQKAGETRVIVEDTGIGISKAEQKRVFERFYRVNKSRSSEISGTGLGLSIVKHGVQFLGGSLQMESQEGEGTKVSMVF
ncbi:MAG: ATP-binding protein [Eubacteriales bacterium]|nr:ATP-binding protein [Eubacteriales bacterium]